MAHIVVERRLEVPMWLSIAVPFLSLCLALIIAAIVFVAQGIDPIAVYGAILPRVVATEAGLSFVVLKLIPLLLCAIGLTLVFKAQVWNIGAEGQLLLGSIAATGLALFVLPNAPTLLLIPTMFLAGFLAGAVWALIPAILKVKLNVNEVITTLMMNYIAYKLVEYLIYGPWRGKRAWGFPITDVLPVKLPTIPGTSIHYPTLLVAVTSAIAIAFVIEKTKFGYEVKVFGSNPDLARAAGVRSGKVIVLCMLLSGGLAGIAGVGEVAGVHGRLMYPWSIAAGYGYTAIIVAWLARLNPLACILTSFLMGTLLVAGSMMRTSFDVPYASVNIFNGLTLLCLVAGEVLLRYRVKLVFYGRGGGVSP